jgi:membrane-bound lytic murein transglycosylase F
MFLRGLFFYTSILIFFACDLKQVKESYVTFIKKDSVLTQQKVQEKPPYIDPFIKKKINLLITNSTNTYFLYKGEAFGLEYELLQLYLRKKGFEVNVELVNESEKIQESLIKKGAHIAAGTFIIPKNNYYKGIKFSDPLYTNDLLLVKHRLDSNGIKELVVLPDAPYVHYLWNEHEDKVKSYKKIYSKTNHSKMWLMHEVETKLIEATIGDESEFHLLKLQDKNLVVDKIICNDAPVGFMFNEQYDSLYMDFKSWLVTHKNSRDYQWILKKYKDLPSDLRYAYQTESLEASHKKISLYDQYIKQYALSIQWDWRMLSALIHQESRFNPHLRSWVGACGLMQVMPKVASVYAHVHGKKLFNPELNIKAGTIYLQWLANHYFKDTSISAHNRLRFLIAAYNAGPGHIEDARALCRKYGLNADVWKDNVEKMVLAKSNPIYFKDPVCKHGYCRGFETVTYVKNIVNYYSYYKNFYSE